MAEPMEIEEKEQPVRSRPVRTRAFTDLTQAFDQPVARELFPQSRTEELIAGIAAWTLRVERERNERGM